MKPNAVQLDLPSEANGAKIKFVLIGKNSAIDGIGILKFRPSNEGGYLAHIEVTERTEGANGLPSWRLTTFDIVEQVQASAIRKAAPGLSYDYELIDPR